MNYTNKIWRITDLVKEIGKWKTEFELTNDIEKLNEIQHFQNLIYLLFNSRFDTGLILKTEDTRLHIGICFHVENTIVISFEMFEKYQRKPCYKNLFCIGNSEVPYKIQYQLAEFILQDDKILEFFR